MVNFFVTQDFVDKLDNARTVLATVGQDSTLFSGDTLTREALMIFGTAADQLRGSLVVLTIPVEIPPESDDGEDVPPGNGGIPMPGTQGSDNVDGSSMEGNLPTPNPGGGG